MIAIGVLSVLLAGALVAVAILATSRSRGNEAQSSAQQACQIINKLPADGIGDMMTSENAMDNPDFWRLSALYGLAKAAELEGDGALEKDAAIIQHAYNTLQLDLIDPAFKRMRATCAARN